MSAECWTLKIEIKRRKRRDHRQSSIPLNGRIDRQSWLVPTEQFRDTKFASCRPFNHDVQYCEVDICHNCWVIYWIKWTKIAPLRVRLLLMPSLHKILPETTLFCHRAIAYVVRTNERRKKNINAKQFVKRRKFTRCSKIWGSIFVFICLSFHHKFPSWLMAIENCKSYACAHGIFTYIWN